MTNIWGRKRTKQLVAAAVAGQLRYDTDGTLVHRSPEQDIAATKRDAAVIEALIELKLLHRDESGTVSAAGDQVRCD